VAGRERPAWVVEARLDREGWAWEAVEQFEQLSGRRLVRRRGLHPAVRRMDQLIAQGRDITLYQKGEGIGFYPDPSPIKELRLRIRNVQTRDILTFEQVQAIISFDFPLIPEVLEPFFAANQNALNASTDLERVMRNAE
jgi:hypothetical protein